MAVGLVEQVGTAPTGGAKLHNCSWEQEERTIAGAMIQNEAKAAMQTGCWE